MGLAEDGVTGPLPVEPSSGLLNWVGFLSVEAFSGSSAVVCATPETVARGRANNPGLRGGGVGVAGGLTEKLSVGPGVAD